MKNKELRTKVNALEDYTRRLHYLFVRSKDLEMVVIKDCPNCGHRTMMEKIFKSEGITFDLKVRCLTCGKIYIVSCKEVMEEATQ